MSTGTVQVPAGPEEEGPLRVAPPPTPAPGGGGRPRDERATHAIAAAALRQLTEIGYVRMSMESVASEAGVARATVYRRYRDKADMVTAAVGSRALALPESHGTPLGDLAAYLEEFDIRFAESCLEVIGCLLASREEPGAMALHRHRVVEPRTAWARELLVAAQRLGQIGPDADIDLVLQMLVGVVFARRVAGVPSEPGWGRRAVEIACRGAGPRDGLPDADFGPGPAALEGRPNGIRSGAPTHRGRRASG